MRGSLTPFEFLGPQYKGGSGSTHSRSLAHILPALPVVNQRAIERVIATLDRFPAIAFDPVGRAYSPTPKRILTLSQELLKAQLESAHSGWVGEADSRLFYLGEVTSFAQEHRAPCGEGLKRRDAETLVITREEIKERSRERTSLERPIDKACKAYPLLKPSTGDDLFGGDAPSVNIIPRKNKLKFRVTLSGLHKGFGEARATLPRVKSGEEEEIGLVTKGEATAEEARVSGEFYAWHSVRDDMHWGPEAERLCLCRFALIERVERRGILKELLIAKEAEPEAFPIRAPLERARAKMSVETHQIWDPAPRSEAPSPEAWRRPERVEVNEIDPLHRFMERGPSAEMTDKTRRAAPPRRRLSVFEQACDPRVSDGLGGEKADLSAGGTLCLREMTDHLWWSTDFWPKKVINVEDREPPSQRYCSPDRAPLSPPATTLVGGAGRHPSIR